MTPSPHNIVGTDTPAEERSTVPTGNGGVGPVVAGEGRYLATLCRDVDVGDGAIMSCPAGELEWQLRYGNSTWVRFITASVVASYAYLLSEEINFKEAARRLRLLRRAQRYTNETALMKVGTQPKKRADDEVLPKETP